MKTVYRFYKKPSYEVLENCEENLSIEDKYPLYAFTNDKDLKDEFLIVRDPDKFIQRKSKMSKEDYVNFANQNSHHMLKHFNYSHTPFYKSKDKEQKTTSIEVVSTWNEKEYTEAFKEDGFIVDMETAIDYNFFPYIFKKKYVDALDKLEFMNFWKLYGNINYYEEIMTDEEYESADYSAPNIQFDDFKTFVALFSDTMKI